MFGIDKSFTDLEDLGFIWIDGQDRSSDIVG